MQVYAPKSTPQELNTNGIGRLTVEHATVHEEINGEYSLTFKVAQSSAHLDAVVIGGIVKADTPRGPQFFRMSKPVTTLDGGKEVFAWHISYDLAQDLILNRAWTGKTGAEALPDILQAGISETRFTGTSDIPLITNMRIVRTSVLGAIIGDQDNSFIKRWGGEIERDNFTVNIKSRLGADKGVAVRYRKNLTGLTLDEDDTELANRIIPTGLDEDDTVIMLPEVYIDSPRINDTPIPHVRHVHFGDVKVGKKDADDNIPYPNANAVIAELRARVAQMYEQGVDLPLKSAMVEFIDLSQTEEYKDYKQLETVHIGDTVSCVYRDVNLSQRVVAYDYDALAKKYIAITLGNVTPTLGDSLWAQDLDLSALKNDVAGTVKQGEAYNDVSITHENGVVTKATISGIAIEVRQNAQDGFAIYANNVYKGGVAVKNGEVVVVSNTLMTDVDSDCWAKIGEDGAQKGIFIYNSNFSSSAPAASLKTRIISGAADVELRCGSGGSISIGPDGMCGLSTGSYPSANITLFPSGSFGLQYPNGNRHLYLENNSFGLRYFDPSGTVRIQADDTAVTIISPDGNNKLGVDNAGPYLVKSGTRTYF
jgi:phage minor structural protein